jgi:hypothetical protein
VGDAGAGGQFDLATIYTGPEAVEAAAAEGIELDTDFYISNVNPRLRPIAVAPNATITTIGDGDLCCEPIPTSLDDFGATFEPGMAVELTVVGGTVTVIAEQYFP